jgi:hypothetical protein
MSWDDSELGPELALAHLLDPRAVRGMLIPIIGIGQSPSATEANAYNKRILP